MNKIITLVVPVFNESSAIEINLPTILSKLPERSDLDFHVLIVDDGSVDSTADWIREFCNNHDNMELLSFNRNFGKEAAIHAGLMYSRGKADAVVVMDSDLQHPPELISQMVNLWLNGVEVVEAYKFSRGRETLASRIMAATFYRLFGFLARMDIKNSSDFKLLDKAVVDAYCALPERKRFFRGMILWLGFSSARLFFDVPERKHGATAWSRLKLLRFSLTAITSFSSTPLHLVTTLGIVCFTLSLVISILTLYYKFSGHAVSGFTTVILLILLIGSFIMFGLGLIGVYIEQIFDEIKQRPTYLVNKHKSYLKDNF